MVPQLNLQNPKIKRCVNQIETNFDEIIKKEKDFLMSYRSISNEETIPFIVKYNKSVEKLYAEIDDYIYQILQFGDEDQTIIKDNLKANGIYI